MTSFFSRLCWVVLLVCSVGACQLIPPTTNFNETPSTTETETLNTVPSPTPLSPPFSTPATGLLPHDIAITPSDERRWDASPVLLDFFTSPGYIDDNWAWATTPDLVIYRDGTVFLESYSLIGDHYEVSLSKGQLTTPELCALLVKIEADGFFDFSPADYQPIDVTDMGATAIHVRAWRQQVFSLYALDYTISEAINSSSDYELNARVPEGLARTYMWLSNYVPPNTQPYTPEKGQLWLYSMENSSDYAVQQWMVEGISLEALLADHGVTDDWGRVSAYIEVEGETLQELWKVLGASRVGYFREGDVAYALTLRPLLPLESRVLGVSGWDVSGKPQFPLTPREPLDCTMEPLPELAGGTLPTPGDETSGVTPHTPTPTATPLPSPFITRKIFGVRDDPSQFDFPSAVAFTPLGEVVVSDGNNGRLQWFSPDGTFLRMTPLNFEGETIWGGDMVPLADGSIAMLDNFRNRLFHVTLDGTMTLLREGWTGDLAGQSPYEFPEYLTQGPDGTFYVVNTVEGDTSIIVVLKPDGSEEVWRTLGNIDLAETQITGLGTDAQGNVYVAARMLDSIIKRTPQGDITTLDVAEPMGLLVLADGSLYVGNDNGIRYYAPDEPKFLYHWDLSDIKYYGIYAFAVGEDKSIYLLDDPSPFDGQGEPVIHHYSSEGAVINTFGDNALHEGQFGFHLAFDVSRAGDAWIVGTDFNGSNEALRLIHLDSADQLLWEGSLTASACNQYALAAHSDQTVFVANPCTHEIRHVASDGRTIVSWGRAGTGDTQFNMIRDIALSPDEQTLYVVDSANGRVTHWTLDGQLLETWSAETLGVNTPTGLAVDGSERFYLLDEATNEIVVFNGGITARWALIPGSGSVTSIAYDASRQWLYVGDSNAYFYIYTPEGALIGQSYVSGSHEVQVDMGEPNRLYASTGYDRIYTYEPK